MVNARQTGKRAIVAMTIMMWGRVHRRLEIIVSALIVDLFQALTFWWGVAGAGTNGSGVASQGTLPESLDSWVVVAYSIPINDKEVLHTQHTNAGDRG
jgi:hypothetical protein